PERAFWPFTPRPAVLPLPEPGPRPTRMRFLVEPSRGLSSLSLVMCASPWRSVARRSPDSADVFCRKVEGSAFDHLDQVVHLGDHAAHRGVVLERGDTTDAVQAQAHEGGALVLLAADRAAGLTNFDLSHRT